MVLRKKKSQQLCLVAIEAERGGRNATPRFGIRPTDVRFDLTAAVDGRRSLVLHRRAVNELQLPTQKYESTF